MNCEETRNELVAAGLGQAETALAAAVARHLEACSSCREEAGEIKKSLESLRRNPPPFELPHALRSRLLSSLDDPEAPSTAPASRLHLRRNRFVSLCALTASAAVLCLSLALLFLFPARPRAEHQVLVVAGRVLSAERGGGSPRVLADVTSGGQKTLDLPCAVLIQGPTRLELPGGISLASREATLVLGTGGVKLERGLLVASVLPGQPFLVETGTARIEVKGTLFQAEVRFEGSAAEATTVAVERGSVLVSAGSGAAREASPGLSLSSGPGGLVDVEAGIDQGLCALVSARDLVLRAGSSEGDASGKMDFSLLNISRSPVRLPPLQSDRPRFSLKFRAFESGFEGVANIGGRNFTVRGAAGARLPEAGTPVVLEPGEALELSFDVSGALSEAGEFEAWGIYQSTPPVAPKVWIGQAVSGPFVIRKTPAEDR